MRRFAFVVCFFLVTASAFADSDTYIDGHLYSEEEILGFYGISAPGVSSTGQARLYFDSTANKLKISENGGAYANIGTGTGGGGSTTGDNLEINSVNVETTADLLDSATVTWTLTSGGGVAADEVTATVVDDAHSHIYSNIDATTSANWATRITDEVGTGYVVFNNSPTLTTPYIGAATGDSLTLDGNLIAENVTVGNGATSGDTLTFNGSAGTDGTIIWNEGLDALNLLGLQVNSAYYFPTSDGTASQVLKTNGSGVLTWQNDNNDGVGGGAPTDADYLVGTANGSLSAEIAVGTAPGGELGGTWASPTLDHDALDDQYYDAEADLTGLLDDNYQAANTVLTELTALTDPGADRIAIWNDATNNFEFLDYSAWDVTAYTGGDFLTLTAHDFDVDTAAVTNGDTTHLSSADAIYDFCETTQAYLQSGDMAKDIVAGTGITGAADDVLYGIDGDLTLAVDTTELDGDRTWGAADGNTITWTWNLVANDPSMTFGPSSVQSNVPLYASYGASAGIVGIYEASGSGTNNATFTVPVLAADTDYILPPDDGDAGEQLQTDGSGTLTWETAGAAGGETLAQTLAIGADANDVDTTSWGKMEGFDAGLYLDWDADGVIDLTSDGTLELHSADWDISTTGVVTGVGNITTDGIIADNDDMVFEADADNDGSNKYSFTDGASAEVASITEAGLLSVLVGIDAIGDVDFDFGSADVDDFTFTTDGTGTAEIVLPAGSIDGTEILDDTIDSDDYADDSIDDAHINWGSGAGQVNVTDVENGTDNIILATEIDTSSEIRAIVSDESGSGGLVFRESPSFVTPYLGVATCDTLTGSGATFDTLVASSSMKIPRGTDPDLDWAGKFAFDTDGANETGDAYFRTSDGTNQYPVGKKLLQIDRVINAPDGLDDPDIVAIWHNTTGMTFTIVEWKAWSDADNVSLAIEELTDMTNFTSITTVDAVEIATDGTSVYYASDTTITHAAIEHDHSISLDFDQTDTPKWVQITIIGWLNANVD